MAEKLCPFLSSAPAGGGLLDAVGGTRPPTMTAYPCQGTRCALFMPMTDEKGNIVGGGCTFLALTGTLSTLVGALMQQASAPAANPDSERKDP